MSSVRSPVVIVGAGHAGGRCAERLRHFGWQDGIVIIGAEPHLPYERPPLSKAVLLDAVEPGPSFIMDAAMIAEHGIEHRLNAVVRGVDAGKRSVTLEDGSQLAYSKLVLATGLAARRLPLIDVLGERVFYLHTFEQAQALRRAIRRQMEVLIIGAGFVGLEVAASAAKAGARVTVIEMAPRALSRVLPATIAEVITERHRKAGVEILCGRSVREVTQAPADVAVLLDNGMVLRPDIIVVGIGGSPNDALALSAGLAVSNGIDVDMLCRTSDADIYAIGDVAARAGRAEERSRIESWMNAEETAAIAARAICGEPMVEPSVPSFWTDQYDNRFQMVGHFHPQAEIYRQGDPAQAGFLAYGINGGRITGAFGVDAPRAVRKAQQIIRDGGAMTHRELLDAGFSTTLETLDA